MLGAGISGCAYYNGLYNARQLAREADIAEREGRRGEAHSLWVQVAIKAESVVVQYPDSKYHDDALFMQGLALSEIDDCGRAVVPLAVALSMSDDDRLMTEIRFLLAECWLVLRDPETVSDVLDPLAHLVDSTVQSRRSLLLGRAALLAGEPDVALPRFSDSRETEARYERAVALMAMGRAREAASVIDSTRFETYFESRWEVALNSIAAVDHRVASALVDRLRDDAHLSEGQEARLLIGDGARWVADDVARARTRFLQAAEVGVDSIEAVVAIAHLTVLAFRRSGDLGELENFRDSFEAIVDDGGSAVTFAEPFVLVLNEAVSELADSSGPLRLFRRAENIRDVLGAAEMAAQVFAEVSKRYPASTIAPKALLAVASLRPQVADSVGRVLRRDYAESPYTRVVMGLPAPTYSAVEDSLRRLLEMMALPGVVSSPSAALPPAFLADTSGGRVWRD